ncbi:MAG TPA: Rieske 2Fe-2S domain-containing protein [Polyangia bacterium]
MTSTITFLGHFGLDVRLGAARVVCDPWLSPRGAYLGAWHQFPANDHLAATDLHDAPMLFVSSPRPDHCDLETLRAFPKTVRVVIPKLASPVLSQRLLALGFGELRELGDGETLDLGDGTRLSIVASTTPHLLGATLVLERGGEVIVDQGDCRLDEAALARLAALEPAVHLLQFSGDHYLPAILELAPDRARDEVARARAALSDRFFDAARRVGARHLVPVGGPPAFVDERDFELNFGGGIFYDVDDLALLAAERAPDLAGRLRPFAPGDVATRGTDDWRFAARRPYDDKRAYLDAYRRVRGPLREAQLAEWRAEAAPLDGKELRSYLRDFFQFEDMTAELGMLVQFSLTDGPSTWVDFRKKPYRYLAECDEPASFVLTVESAWVSLVLEGKLTWHDLFMGRLASIKRDPDRDIPKLMHHFDYRHDEALFNLVRLIDPVLITLEDEQMEYVCQRFCPHRGRDLEYATIERGVLTCTAHGWRFDLRRGGRCLWGGETPLLVKEIRPRKA